MKDEESESKNSIRGGTSFWCAALPSARKLQSVSEPLILVDSLNIGVSIGPLQNVSEVSLWESSPSTHGQMQLTLIFLVPNSFAALLVMPTTACFDAEYARFFAAPMTPRILAALTIAAPSLKCGT